MIFCRRTILPLFLPLSRPGVSWLDLILCWGSGLAVPRSEPTPPGTMLMMLTSEGLRTSCDWDWQAVSRGLWLASLGTFSNCRKKFKVGANQIVRTCTIVGNESFLRHCEHMKWHKELLGPILQTCYRPPTTNMNSESSCGVAFSPGRTLPPLMWPKVTRSPSFSTWFPFSCQSADRNKMTATNFPTRLLYFVTIAHSEKVRT